MNPIQLEIFHHRFLSIVEGMGATIRRTAFSQRIKEGGAYSCGLFDLNGRMVSYISPIPVHLGVGSLTLSSIKKQITEMNPGDIYIMNDPFKGGTHLSNITLVAPVFNKRYGNKPIFYLVSSVHHSEVGGISPGGILLSKSIIEEGVFIEPIKLIDQGKINYEFLDAFSSKVTYPKERESDLNSQIFSCKVGVKNMENLLKKYGYSRLQKSAELIMDHSERLMRKTIKEIPNGEYQFIDYLDGDGLGNRKIKIRVTVKISDETAKVIFTRSHEVVRGPMNAVLSITNSAVLYVFMALAPQNIPLNEGCNRAIEIVTKKHTILNASYPSSVAGGATETAQRIVDVILGALSKGMKGKIPAASQGTMNSITITGFDSSKNKPFTFYETIPGGVGGCENYEAPNGLQTHMMNILNESIESIEHRYPVRVLRYCIRKHSGGDGVYKGGNGVLKEYQIMCNASITILSERRLKAPYGLEGGKSGKRGTNLLIKHNGKEVHLDSKCYFKVEKGDRVIIETPGGGGWGKKED